MNDVNFWENNIQIGYYDLNFRKGLKKNRGLRFSWHNFTFNEVLKHINPNGKNLDYACGPGTFIGQFDLNNTLGYDISSSQINYAKKNYSKNYFTNDLKIVKKQGPYDSITVIGLLEFLSKEEIFNLFSELKLLLKPNGKIIFTTPNYGRTMRFTQWFFNLIGGENYKNVTVNKLTNKNIQDIKLEKYFKDIEIYKILNLGIFFSFFNNNFSNYIHKYIGKITNNNFGLLYIIKVRI